MTSNCLRLDRDYTTDLFRQIDQKLSHLGTDVSQQFGSRPGPPPFRMAVNERHIEVDGQEVDARGL